MSGTCAHTLGGDTVCPGEEAAFVQALQQYALCYTGKMQGLD